MSSIASSPALLDTLPNELLVFVLQGMPDLVTLQSFIEAYPAAQELFKYYHQRILSTVISQLDSMQIQRLISAVINIRNIATLPIEEEFFDDHLYIYLGNEELPLVVDKLIDPLISLRDIALVIQDIKILQTSFIDRRLRQPGTPLNSSEVEKPPSQTELHRISRGLWRLQFLSETIRADFRSGGQSYYGSISFDFIILLLEWEIEEVECVYYHICEKYNLLIPNRYFGMPHYVGVSLLSQPPIIQRFFKNTLCNKESPRTYLEGVDDNATWDPSEFASLFSAGREFPWAQGTVWSDKPETNSPNEGWLYYRRQSNVIGTSFEPEQWVIRGPVVCFLHWGYCIWDHERLRKWGVLGSGGHVDIAKWSNNYSGWGFCDHCYWTSCHQTTAEVRRPQSSLKSDGL